ncbi:DeoR/GlpR family DNA-binding transcription regulator [Gracilibacillus dipsosauri]|uniref:DeoR/GlpR family DNA-binding transcription regulator n=1 Tax=Gracilibacillus dipsosauri TaxID=178340 RepID=UPI0024099262
MLPLERQQKIVELLKEKEVLTVSELSSYFQVHEATIRRDLTVLEKRGMMRRSHGGVMLVKEIYSEPTFQERESAQYEEKKRIGEKAAEFIEDGDSIILDSGTTTLHIAKAIQNRNNITVVTNDINIAAILRFSKTIKVIVSGGVLYPESFMLNGIITNQVLNTLNIQKAFIATPAMHNVKGITHFDDYLVSAKRAMIDIAKKVIVVADHTKLGRLSLHSVAGVDKVHDLITGKEANFINLQEWESSGIQVHFA